MTQPTVLLVTDRWSWECV